MSVVTPRRVPPTSCQWAIEDAERDQLALPEDRQREDHVVQVRAHDVAIVGEQDVAGVDVLLAVVGQLRLDGVGEPADEHRQARGRWRRCCRRRRTGPR